MTTYWHVASSDYRAGDDLLSYDAQYERWGVEPTWKWEGEPIDTDVICLFETRDEAEDMLAEYGGQLLKVELIEDDLLDLRMTRVGEGYPAIQRLIPARCITRAPALV